MNQYKYYATTRRDTVRRPFKIIDARSCRCCRGTGRASGAHDDDPRPCSWCKGTGEVYIRGRGNRHVLDAEVYTHGPAAGARRI